MLGSAKITYMNEDVCQLVRKDLVDKFGNRELANYNLYLPGVVRPQATVTDIPAPEVKITSVEDQIKAMGVLPKPSVARSADSVSASTIGVGAPLISNFDANSKKLVITGGPVSFTTSETSGKKGHWYLIEVGVPVGLEIAEGQIISFTQNGEPKSYIVTENDIDNWSLSVEVDAKFTTMDLIFNWDVNNEPEKISTICNATLAETAISKIPEFPTQPKFEFVYPESVTVDSNVSVTVDLDCGKK